MRRLARRTLVAAAVAVGLALPASGAAENVPIRLAIASGGLGVKALDTAAVPGTTTVRVRVVDARGTGAGWQLRLLPRDGGVTVTGLRLSCATGSTCTLPRTTVRYPVQLDRSGAVLDAVGRTGMGAIDVVLTVSSNRAARLGFAVG